MSPLRLFGITTADGVPEGPLAGAEQTAFRDVIALTATSPHARPDLTPAELTEHHRICEAVFAERAILPAPPGVIFRTPDALMRWLELHYVTFTDALAFVEGRQSARVHITARTEAPKLSETGELADIDAIAADSFRVLRRHAVASVSITVPGDATGAHASFLIEGERWPVFRDVVSEEGRRTPDLLYSVTGPWPPYDFVRMSFGS